MKAPVVQLRSQVSEPEIKKRAAARALRSELVLELTGDCDVYQPDGVVLCKLRRAVIPKKVNQAARPSLRLTKSYASQNRTTYGGGASAHIIKKDGTRSGSTVAFDEKGKELKILSSVAGYFENQGGRFQFCRTTAYTADNVREWNVLLPLVRTVADRMKADCPEQFARQQAFTDRCNKDYVIAGTPFTTLTININVLGTIHRDTGDFKEGIGCITCHRAGQYEGALLCFPQFKVGVELFDGDLIFFNPHAWHAVTEFEGTTSRDRERITVVYYARSGMIHCKSAAEELEKAKAAGVL